MRLNCKFNTSFEYESPEEFLQSQWQTSKRSFVYLIYRWMVASFFVLSVLVNLFNAAVRSEITFYLIYLTHWNLVITMISTVWSAVLVSLHYAEKLKVGAKMTMALKLHWLLSTSSNMYALLVTTIYWAVLYRNDANRIDLNNVVVHATNSLVLIFNMAIVRQPERFGLFVYPLCCGCIYLLFTWFYPFLGGKNRRGQDFIYPILNWNQKPWIALVAAIAVTVTGALFHLMICGIQQARSSIFRKFTIEEEKKSEVLILTC